MAKERDTKSQSKAVTLVTDTDTAAFGIPGVFDVWSISPARTRASFGRFPQGSPGIYQVGVFVGSPGSYHRRTTLAHRQRRAIQVDIERESQEAGSYLLIAGRNKGRNPKPAHIEWEVAYRVGETSLKTKCLWCANKQGHLAEVSFPEIKADTFEQAARIAYNLTAGRLSAIAFAYDIPLEVVQMTVIETATLNMCMLLTAPHHFRTLGEPPLSTTLEARCEPHYRAVISLYREAVNSTSPAYQFLCYYRIIELMRAYRSLTATSVGQNQKAGRYTGEVIPRFSIGRYEFPTVAQGRKFSWVVDNLLRPKRVGIAHALTDKGHLVLTPDEFLNVLALRETIPLAKYIAREMVSNSFPENDEVDKVLIPVHEAMAWLKTRASSDLRNKEDMTKLCDAYRNFFEFAVKRSDRSFALGTLADIGELTANICGPQEEAQEQWIEGGRIFAELLDAIAKQTPKEWKDVASKVSSLRKLADRLQGLK